MTTFVKHSSAKTTIDPRQYTKISKSATPERFKKPLMKLFMHQEFIKMKSFKLRVCGSFGRVV